MTTESGSDSESKPEQEAAPQEEAGAQGDAVVQGEEPPSTSAEPQALEQFEGAAAHSTPVHREVSTPKRRRRWRGSQGMCPADVDLELRSSSGVLAVPDRENCCDFRASQPMTLGSFARSLLPLRPLN